MRKVLLLLLTVLILLSGCSSSKENNTNTGTAESQATANSNTNHNQQQSEVYIDLPADYCKYRDISNLENSDNYDFYTKYVDLKSLGITDGVEVYGIYFDLLIDLLKENEDSILNAEEIIINFPSTIENKQILFICNIDDSEFFNDGLYKNKKVSYAVPESVLAIHSIITFRGYMYLNDKCKAIYYSRNIAHVPKEMTYAAQTYFMIPKKNRGNEIVVNGACLEDVRFYGFIDKITFNNPTTKQTERIGYFGDDYYDEEVFYKEEKAWTIKDVYINGDFDDSSLMVNADNVYISDNVTINRLNLNPHDSLSIGNGFVVKNPDIITRGDDDHADSSLSKLEIGSWECEDKERDEPCLLGLAKVVDKDTKVINISDEEINWSMSMNFYNEYGHYTSWLDGIIPENQVFKSGRIDMGSYYIDVTNEPRPVSENNKKSNSSNSSESNTYRIKITTNVIKIRSTPSAPSDNSNKVGTVKEGEIYTVYETTTAEGYTWYRIGDNQWIADDGTWTTKVD